MNFSNKGIVLISILLIVLLLSAIAVTFGNKYLLSLKRAQYIEFQSLSLNTFGNIEELALMKIDKSLRFNSNQLSKENLLFKEKLNFNVNGAEIIGTIQDASNCFNINSLVKKNKNNFKENKKSTDAFRKYMNSVNIDTYVIEEIIDQIIDWIDSDSNPREYGLEDYYYTGPLHSPKEYSGGRLFIDIEELKSIPAIRQVDWKIFGNHFCAYSFESSLKININTIDYDDLLFLNSVFPNMDLKDTEYILQNIPVGGFKSLSSMKQTFQDIDLSQANAEISFTSNVFDIETTIQFENFFSSSKSIIIYGNNKKGYIVSRIYTGI